MVDYSSSTLPTRTRNHSDSVVFVIRFVPTLLVVYWKADPKWTAVSPK
jgi:hypothetical protein